MEWIWGCMMLSLKVAVGAMGWFLVYLIVIILIGAIMAMIE
jgi:polyferredoxin